MILSIAICKDPYYWWHERFADALAEYSHAFPFFRYDVIDIEVDNWINLCLNYDVIIYKPSVLGVEASQLYKEKILFIEHYLKKIVFPNYKTVWHYESKIAQSYLFKHFRIKTPLTFVSFNSCDTFNFLKSASLPLVLKESHGAGGSKVRLIKYRSQAQKISNDRFSSQLWSQFKLLSKKTKYLSLLFHSWFWQKLLVVATGKSPFNSIYFQEYVPDNARDLRVTVIGGNYAYAFWRHNRKNDFRASGSGIIDYISEIPAAPILFCIEKSKEFGFDSMAYDLIYKNSEFVIVEMSCVYSDRALYNAKGYWQAESDVLKWIPGNYWPQSIWIQALMDKLSPDH